MCSYNILAPVYVRPLDQRTGKVQPYAAFEWAEPAEEVLEWETWDPAKGPFWHHAVAGSCAGVMEHLAMFPVVVADKVASLPLAVAVSFCAVRTTRHVHPDPSPMRCPALHSPAAGCENQTPPAGNISLPCLP